MLVMFRAKNFSSFQDDIILDMRASSYTQHPSHVIELNQFKLLKTLAIYGANASGKSNLISAMHWFEHYIFNQLFQEKPSSTSSDGEKEDGRIPSIQPFVLREHIDPYIEFEMIFIHRDILFHYGYSFKDTLIRSEWLSIDSDIVFERSIESGVVPGKKYQTQLKNLTKYREDRLYLSVLDYFATDEIKEMIDCFKDFFRDRFNVHLELILESSIKGTVGILVHSKRLITDEAFRAKVASYISKIDVGIEDIILENELILNKKNGKKEEHPTIKTIHPVYNENGIRVGSKSFDLPQESSGTLRFLSFIQEILILLESGGVFVIDELSARLHPLLTKFIVDIFQSDTNSKNAQLIFTTHDTSILNKDQFRRDEIIFVDKNDRGESSLYSLADLKTVRQDATYNKDYFNGKYGAIPIFRTRNGGE